MFFSHDFYFIRFCPPERLPKQLAHLVSKSIVTLKEMGYVNVRFLSLLPIDKENPNPIYQVVFQEVQQLFNQYDLLPTTDSTFSRPQHCLLASSKKMVELLSSENINSLFHKNYWIDTEITYAKNSTRLLWTYLKECLKIKEISPYNFLSSITYHFLIQQSDEWIINFYVFLNQTPSHERSKAIYQPIIRLENNDHVKPYRNDNSPQVYFPKENSSRFQTIKKNILENKEAKIFLESLGIKEPDEIAEIKTFICPKYLEFPDDRISEEEYLKDLDYVYKIWNNATPQKQEEITNDLLGDSYFIGCFDNQKRFILRKKENEDNYDYYSNEPKSIVYWLSGNRGVKCYY